MPHRNRLRMLSPSRLSLSHSLDLCFCFFCRLTAAQSTAYTSNATNLIQNSMHLAQSLNAVTAVVAATEAAKSTANFKSYVNPADIGTATVPAAPAAAPEATEKRSPTDNKRYAIAARAPQNAIVKQVLDRLLTPFVADQLAGDADDEVLKLLTSNTRNPYLIWDNSTRAQLIDFLERERVRSAREQYEDVAEIWQLVQEFRFDAHRWVSLWCFFLRFDRA